MFRLLGLQDYCSPNHFPDDKHLLADKAYTIQPCIMVPYRNNGHLRPEETRYNDIHSSSQMVIERTNGLLKGRFRSLLEKLPFTRTDLIPYYVLACCVLHNICLSMGDLVDTPIILDENLPMEPLDIINNDLRMAGLQKRERIYREK